MWVPIRASRCRLSLVRVTGNPDPTRVHRTSEWISRWFARERKSDRKRAEQGCVDLTVKRELLDEDAVPLGIPPVAQGSTSTALVPSGARKRVRKKIVKAETVTEALPDLPSSPSLRLSSPMLPSSSPPRTPPHIATRLEPSVHGDTPFRLTDADSTSRDHLIGYSEATKSEDVDGAFLLPASSCSDYAPAHCCFGDCLSWDCSPMSLETPDQRGTYHPFAGNNAPVVSGSGTSSSLALYTSDPALAHEDNSAPSKDASHQSDAVSSTRLHVLRWF